MKCYYHPQVDAVGICKYCNKGLCLASAIDVGGGLACIGSCEERVKIMLENMEKVRETPKFNLKDYKVIANIMIGMGILFGLGGLGVAIEDNISVGTPMVLCSLLFIGMGIYYYKVTAR